MADPDGHRQDGGDAGHDQAADDAVDESAAGLCRVARRCLGEEFWPEILQPLAGDVYQHPYQDCEGCGHGRGQQSGHEDVCQSAPSSRGNGRFGRFYRGVDEVGHAMCSPVRLTIHLPATLTRSERIKRAVATTKSESRWNGWLASVNSLAITLGSVAPWVKMLFGIDNTLLPISIVT